MIFSPALIMILGGLVMPMLQATQRQIFIVALPILTLWMVWTIPGSTTTETLNIAGFALAPKYIHDYTLIFATIFSIAAFAAGIFCMKQARRGEIAASYVYAGAAIGVTFSGDLITLFTYWEIMAISSTIVVWAGRKKHTGKAGLRYAYTHFIGGVILLSGIAAHISNTGDVSIASFLANSNADMAHILILIGILLNAAAPPFSGWLPDAYPSSSPFGAVFLSSFTTKTAVFVLMTLFSGREALIYVGLIMVFYGIIYAMLENNIRRILSYSIINQVGFMITGIGIGTKYALAGVATHAFCHIIYKSLLFMSAGSVIYMTGNRRCTDLGGLHHSMKFTTFCAIVGALAISALPLTSGFVSKSIIASAAAQEHLTYVWFLLLVASAGVFLHAGIKFPWFVFFHKDSGLRPKDPPMNMKIGMGIMVAGCFLPAFFPAQFYAMFLPETVDYVPYTSEHVITQLQLLMFSGLAFFVMLPYLKRTLTITLDFDWFYRVFSKAVLEKLERTGYFLREVIIEVGDAIWGKALNAIKNTHGPGKIAARNWGIAVTTLATTTLLGILLIAYY